MFVAHLRGLQSFGVTANEPTFDWHLQNIQHYEWKRGLARQAIATPGNFYPEERVLRTHMIKSGQVRPCGTSKIFHIHIPTTNEIEYLYLPDNIYYMNISVRF